MCERGRERASERMYVCEYESVRLGEKFSEPGIVTNSFNCDYFSSMMMPNRELLSRPCCRVAAVFVPGALTEVKLRTVEGSFLVTMDCRVRPYGSSRCWNWAGSRHAQLQDRKQVRLVP